MTQIIHIRMQLCSSSIHPNFDDTNHPHWMLLYTINIHPKHDDKIIHMWMRLYSSNKHPKFDDTNHPHSDVIAHIKKNIQNLTTQIIHIGMLLYTLN